MHLQTTGGKVESSMVDETPEVERGVKPYSESSITGESHKIAGGVTASPTPDDNAVNNDFCEEDTSNTALAEKDETNKPSSSKRVDYNLWGVAVGTMLLLEGIKRGSSFCIAQALLHRFGI